MAFHRSHSPGACCQELETRIEQNEGNRTSAIPRQFSVPEHQVWGRRLNQQERSMDPGGGGTCTIQGLLRRAGYPRRFAILDDDPTPEIDTEGAPTYI